MIIDCFDETSFITGLKDNSIIIYYEPNKLGIGRNGTYTNHLATGSITFDLKESSASINLLSKLTRGEEPFNLKIVNGNDSDDVKVSGNSFKIYSNYNKTRWTINDFHENVK